MKTTATDRAEDGHDSGETVVDVNLFKRIGLYQLLRPSESDGDHDCGKQYRTAILVILCLTFGMQIVQSVRLYWALDDIQQFLFLASVLITGLMCILKGYVMVTNAKHLWSVLDVATYAFTTAGCQDPSILRQCRDTLSIWLHTFVVLSYCTLAFWNAAPWFVGSAIYESPVIWTLVYLMEAFILTVNVFCWLLFDCYFVTITFVLRAQLLTIAAGYESVGRRRQLSRPKSPSLQNTPDNRMKGDVSKFDYHYNDLILHVKDNQNVIRKFDEFFDTVRPLVLLQVVQGASESMILILLTAFAYLMNSSIVSAPVLKFASGFASLTFELYIYCYALNNLEVAKSIVNFGLYCSNWTEMDLKFKKTLLLVMHMNTAHTRVMKVSPKSIINMEMFARVMNMSYSIVSVILRTKHTIET